MRLSNQCQHSTKLTGQCVKCGQYPHESFPSLLQSAEDQRRETINEREEWNSRDEEPGYSLRDEGRNPDGSGESYAERNI